MSETTHPISLRLDEGHLKILDYHMRIGPFRSRSEVIREAIQRMSGTKGFIQVPPGLSTDEAEKFLAAELARKGWMLPTRENDHE